MVLASYDKEMRQMEQERLVLYLGCNLAAFELNGMPKNLLDGVYKLSQPDKLPKESRFVAGASALIYTQSSNNLFVYIGAVHNIRLVRHLGQFTFGSVEQYIRPIVIDENGELDTSIFADKGFCNDFMYIPESSFDAAL